MFRHIILLCLLTAKNVAADICESDDDFVDNVGDRRKKVDEPNMGSVKGMKNIVYYTFPLI